MRRLGLSWLLLGVGVAGAVVAFAVRPSDAAAAAGQDWSPFVLVAGLLLIGLVADGDGLFAAAGRQLASRAPGNGLLFAGAVIVIGVVTATLNLDTSVAFLTPVLVYTARSRGAGEAALLYGCLLLSNAGSLLLPGSNLTNLIVLGHLRLSGRQFAARMWLPWLGALLVTACVVAWLERRSLRSAATLPVADAGPGRPVFGVGLTAVVLATAASVTLASPALPVAIVGVIAVTIRVLGGKTGLGGAIAVLGVPVLAGLFGVAVALGTLGRSWAGPAIFLAGLPGWLTAVVAAGGTVLVNNLPAAALLAARTPAHPVQLLVGLNLGPNLLVTGSLAWLLWLRAARAAGAAPSLVRASKLGAVVVPLSMAVALAALAVTGA